MKEMDWNSSAEDIISTYTNSQPLDCIIATGRALFNSYFHTRHTLYSCADVVYDTEVINAFVHVLATLLKSVRIACVYVTCNLLSLYLW